MSHQEHSLPNSAEVQHQTQREIITAIDDNGALYPVNKWDAHVHNIPHLAVSVFLFNQGRLLLQQRADCKYHSGGLWANTCCSHPRWNESLAECAKRRLFEEVGCQNVELIPFGNIHYTAAVSNDSNSPLYENEAATCFVGYMHDDQLPDLFCRTEVQAVRWQSMPALYRDMQQHPQHYSRWLEIYINKHYEMIADVADGISPTQQHRLKRDISTPSKRPDFGRVVETQ